MDKRYQVFVSSTYADLKDARRAVIQTLMEMDCIPAGMELFPAADEAQWEFIKKVIDDCDYYVLVIGGRYGSMTDEGVSYTEKEHDYAVEKGLKVLAFVHASPETIPAGDEDAALKPKLEAFRARVAAGRLVKEWVAPSELPGLVALSLNKTIKSYPAVGWVRGDQVASSALLAEVNELRKVNSQLSAELAKLEAMATPVVENLAGLDEMVSMHGAYHVYRSGDQRWELALSWGDLFALVGPYLISNPAEAAVMAATTNAVFRLSGKTGLSHSLDDQDFQTMKVQFIVLGLVDIQVGHSVQGTGGVFWYLTPGGRTTLMQLRSVRSAKK